MSDFWNARYASDAYAYGEQPNAYFKAVIDTLPPGRLLVPGAGSKNGDKSTVTVL